MHRATSRPMSRPARAAVAFAAIALLLVLCPPAWALKPTVVDGGDLFQPETIDKANAVIRQIKQAFGKDLMVETYPTVPESLRGEFQKEGKERFYQSWLADRAKALGVDGIFILIVREPGRAQIGIGRGVVDRLFTVQDRKELQQVLTEHFRQRRFDDGLLAGVEFVQKRLERNAGNAADPLAADHRPEAGPAAAAGVSPTATAGPDHAERPDQAAAPAARGPGDERPAPTVASPTAGPTSRPASATQTASPTAQPPGAAAQVGTSAGTASGATPGAQPATSPSTRPTTEPLGHEGVDF